jgi:hypothetical protein
VGRGVHDSLDYVEELLAAGHATAVVTLPKTPTVVPRPAAGICSRGDLEPATLVLEAVLRNLTAGLWRESRSWS